MSAVKAIWAVGHLEGWTNFLFVWFKHNWKTIWMLHKKVYEHICKCTLSNYNGMTLYSVIYFPLFVQKYSICFEAMMFFGCFTRNQLWKCISKRKNFLGMLQQAWACMHFSQGESTLLNNLHKLAGSWEVAQEEFQNHME